MKDTTSYTYSKTHSTKHSSSWGLAGNQKSVKEELIDLMDTQTRHHAVTVCVQVDGTDLSPGKPSPCCSWWRVHAGWVSHKARRPALPRYTHTEQVISVINDKHELQTHTHLISQLASSTQTHRQPRTSSIAPCCLATAEFAPTLHGERVKWVCVGIGVCLCVFSYITTASRCECVMINPQNDFFD